MTNKKYVIISVIIIQILIFAAVFIKIFIIDKQKTVKQKTSTSNSITPTQKYNTLKHLYYNPNDIEKKIKLDWKKDEITYKFNYDYQNDSKKYYVQKYDKTFRIVTLGDSFTFGEGVNTEENWTELLENKLNERKICKNIDKFEVINMGVPGYDIEYAVEFYRLKGKYYNPDLIIWTHSEWDKLSEETLEYLKICTQQAKTQADNDTCWKKTKENTSFLYNSIELMKIQKERLEKIYQFYNKKIFFIDFYGDHETIIDTKNKHFILKDVYSKIQEYIPKNKIFLPNKYPTPEAHKIISEIIFDQLFKNQQIHCESMQ